VQSLVGRVQAEAIPLKFFWYAYEKRLYVYPAALHAFRLGPYAYGKERYRQSFFGRLTERSRTRTGRT
jgi:hypothetical protein